MSEGWTESELRAALEEAYRPAPWLLSNSIGAVRRSRPVRPALGWVAGIAAALVAVSSIALFESVRQHQSPNRTQTPSVNTSLLPQPVAQPITRTSPGAQVAWLWMQSQDQGLYLIAVDTRGRVVAHLTQSADPYGIWRSADGATMYVPGVGQITGYSALDGTVEQSYDRNSGTIIGDTFSPDGRWLALLLLNNGLQLQVIDLKTGTSQALPILHDTNASLPGMSCNPTCGNAAAWGLAVFSPDSTMVYTLTDWGGPVRLSAFSLASLTLMQTATAVDGEQGRKFATCAAPAMAAKVVDAGRTLVAFCHGGGAVWFFDLATLTSTGIVQTKQPNPFWLSPIFTPDGRLLYLHQGPGFGDSMQVVDLAKRKLLGPVPTPTDKRDNGPFAWLVTNAYAGGVASTVPVSPDGLTLYSATTDGVMALRIPDLKPLAKLAPGFSGNEVWISGDGQTIYVTSEDGKTLLVMHSDGSKQQRVNLPDISAGFIASEHG